MQQRILIVEDDRTIAGNLYDYLESQGFHCDHAASLAEARQRRREAGFDAILLDRGLPDGDGADFANEMRGIGDLTPILMLTARDTLDDKVAGFESGADDYLVKPFSLREVVVRLHALLRRVGAREAAGAQGFCGLFWDADAQAVLLHGQELDLPPKATRLLQCLLQHPGRVISRGALEEFIWGHPQASSDNLRSLLLAVRRALAVAPELAIVNTHGMGYKLARQT